MQRTTGCELSMGKERTGQWQHACCRGTFACSKFTSRPTHQAGSRYLETVCGSQSKLRVSGTRRFEQRRFNHLHRSHYTLPHPCYCDDRSPTDHCSIHAMHYTLRASLLTTRCCSCPTSIKSHSCRHDSKTHLSCVPLGVCVCVSSNSASRGSTF